MSTITTGDWVGLAVMAGLFGLVLLWALLDA